MWKKSQGRPGPPPPLKGKRLPPWGALGTMGPRRWGGGGGGGGGRPGRGGRLPLLLLLLLLLELLLLRCTAAAALGSALAH
jgi:hypothetical protein